MINHLNFVKQGHNCTSHEIECRIQEYNFENRAIGEGGFGKVFKAFHKPTKQWRAVKIINRKQCDKAYM